MHVFSAKGYEAASLTDLTEAMGINRVSMYATFGNKEALFVKAMSQYTDAGEKRLGDTLATGTAREGLEQFLRDTVMMFTDTAGPGVCFVTQGPLTGSTASDEITRFIARKRAAIEPMLERHFERATKAGELTCATPPGDLARFYFVLLQGLALQAQHGGTRDQLLRLVDLAMEKWPSAHARADERLSPIRGHRARQTRAGH